MQTGSLAPLRITYVARRAWPAIGGMENYLRFMTDALPALERVQILAAGIDHRGIAFTDLLERDAFEPFARGQVTTEPLRVRGARRLRMLPVVAQPRFDWAPRGRGWLGRRSFNAFAAGTGPAIADAADRPDVLHVFSGGNLAAAGVAAARLLGIPLVVTPQAHPGQWDDDPQSGRAYRAAARVLASGEADAATYRGLGVPESRLRLTAPCTAHLPAGGGARIRAEHGITGSLVLYVGRRQAYKGVDLLIEAVGRLGDVSLALVGAGEPLRADPGAARLIDVGQVDDDEKAAWLDAADVLCLPSANESFGLTVAEGWSLGVPAVTSDIPVLRALVERVGGGVAVNRTPEALAAGLRHVLDDPGRARRMGQAGLEHWRAHLSPEASARRHLAVYEELVEDASRKATA